MRLYNGGVAITIRDFRPEDFEGRLLISSDPEKHRDGREDVRVGRHARRWAAGDGGHRRPGQVLHGRQALLAA